MASRSKTSPGRAKRGATPPNPVPAPGASGDNSAGELTEAPLPRRKRDPLDPHDFGDGGGEAFRRTQRPRPK